MKTYRVLLLDDDRDYYILIKHILNQAQKNMYALDFVSTCDEASQRLAQSTYDIILIDYFLNHETGTEMLKKLDWETVAEHRQRSGLIQLKK